MRLITFLFILQFSMGCGSSSKITTAKSNPLNGTWIPIQQEIGGTALPKPAFEKQSLIINDSTYTFMAESIDKGVVLYNADKMDIYGREGVNTGKHFTAIYKLENGQLTICYNLKGDNYPASYETKGKPTLFLSVFKKQ